MGGEGGRRLAVGEKVCLSHCGCPSTLVSFGCASCAPRFHFDAENVRWFAFYLHPLVCSKRKINSILACFRLSWKTYSFSLCPRQPVALCALLLYFYFRFSFLGFANQRKSADQLKLPDTPPLAPALSEFVVYLCTSSTFKSQH